MSGIALTVLIFGIVLILGFLVWYVIKIYNDFVSVYQRVEQARQNIDVLLTQRTDELAKLIDAADVYMEHEESLLTELTEAREEAERAATPSEEAEADQKVRNALSSFRARAENYPELRSQQNVLQLQNRISRIEDKIASRREFYNEAVTQYNTKIKQYPHVIFAGVLRYTEEELFIATDEAKEDVNVADGFN